MMAWQMLCKTSAPSELVWKNEKTEILNFGVDRMVYISCKPTSLARDLEMLQEQGYKVEKACAVDMFPGTVHVETVVKLHRKDI